MPSFVLASQSPARLQTLRNAGLNPVVIVSGVDESVLDGLHPRELALGLAELKAAAVADRVSTGSTAVAPGVLILGCDSVLEFDGQALGKPGDADTTRARWQQMRGQSGVLVTGHSLIDTANGTRVSKVASTTVYFADIDDDEIDAYVATGEPLHVAGAFTVDSLGGAFVTRIEGDYHNVVGVSLPLLREMVVELGHRWTSLWTTAQ